MLMCSNVKKGGELFGYSLYGPKNKHPVTFVGYATSFTMSRY